MGVEGFIGHYLRVHKFKNVELKNIPGYVVNNLLMDSNSLLHNSAAEVYKYGDWSDEKARAELKNVDPTILEKRFLDKIVENLRRVTKTFRASDFLMISIDGPATVSKIIQQRSRRYKAALNSDPSMLFKTSSISPGTDLMFKIDTVIQEWLRDNYIYLAKKVIYSNHLMPLEGETKLFNYVRNNNLTGNTVVYGLDTDLVFLSMLCPLKNIYLSRNNEFDIINIDAFRAAISSKYLQDSSIVDFVFLSFMIGNDFMPRAPAFHDINAAYEQIEIWYKALRSGIIEAGTVNWINFASFLKSISVRETKLLQDVANTPTTYKNPLFDVAWDVSGNGVKVFNYSRFRDYYYAHALNPKVVKLPESTLKVFIPNGATISDMCRNYLSTMVWNINFYINGINNLNIEHYYAYNYAPLLSDLRDYALNIADAVRNNIDPNSLLQRTIKSIEDRIMNPLQQLLCIIPPQNWDVLPSQCATYVDYNSPIYDIFTTKFDIDYYGKDKEYQGVAILPPIDPDTVFNKVLFSTTVLQNYTPFGDLVYTQNAETQEYKQRRMILRDENGKDRGRGGGRGRGRGRGGFSEVKNESAFTQVQTQPGRGRGGARGRGGPRGRGSSRGKY